MLNSSIAADRQRPAAQPAGQPMPLSKYWDSLALLLLILASVPGAWLSPRSLVVVPNAGLIDDNWHLDEVFKLSRGIWVGRDVAFTHGPIFQWLSSVPARTMGLSMGAIYATKFTVLAWCAFVFTYLTYKLLLPEQPAWKRTMPLLLICMFWGPNLRTSYPILLFAVFLRGMYAVLEGRLRGLVLGAGAAVLCGIGVLIASDSGIYSIAAWLTALAAVVFEFRRDWRAPGKLLLILVSFVASFAIIALLINALMASSLDFRFWKDSVEMVRVYRWATPFRITTAGTWHLLGMLLGGAAVFLLRALTRRDHSALTQRTGFLLGGFAFSVAMMQSGLVRSDYGHTVTAVLATAVLCGAILFSFSGTRQHALAVLFAFGCSAVFGELAFSSSGILRNYTQVAQPLTECPAGFQEFDRACFRRDFVTMLRSASSYLGRQTPATASIVVFPYQTLFGIATQRNVAGGLIQPYTASGPYLSRLEIAGLERGAAPAGLYLPDADFNYMSQPEVTQWSLMDLSLPVDGVGNFTRTPEVWFWLLHHYRVEPEALATGVFGLMRDESRAARISVASQSLGLPLQTYPVAERASAIDLGSPIWPAGYDFLRLRLNVRYPFWWKLRKPSRMQLEITRADGRTELQWFVAEPGVTTEVWFYPWSPSELVHYFEADAGRWRPGVHPAITRLRVLVTPWDWVSVQPGSIVVESADAIRIDMAP